MAHFQKDGLWVQGGSGALANVSEDTPFVPGQVGRVMSIRSTDTKVPRFYQYVLRSTTETAAAAAGGPAYWADFDDFIVTPDSARSLGGTTTPTVAGVWLGTSPAAGKYGFIEVDGLATVAVTDTVLPGERLVANGTNFKALAAITITSQAVSVPLNQESVGFVAQTTSIETALNSDCTAKISCLRNGW
jgi:hypothetical protein